MANHKTRLLAFEAETGEVIEAIVVGIHYNREWQCDGSEKPRADENIVLDRDTGLAKLDEEYNDGYGGADCYPFYAWSRSWVALVSEYDGATGVTYIPRNPTPVSPSFI